MQKDPVPEVTEHPGVVEFLEYSPSGKKLAIAYGEKVALMNGELHVYRGRKSHNSPTIRWHGGGSLPTH
jgi:hypothetical protein